MLGLLGLRPSVQALSQHVCCRGRVYYPLGAALVCWEPLSGRREVLRGHGRDLTALCATRSCVLSADDTMLVLWDAQTNLRVGSVYLEGCQSLSASSSDMAYALAQGMLYVFRVSCTRGFEQHAALRLNNIGSVPCGTAAGATAVYARVPAPGDHPSTYACLFRAAAPENNYIVTWVVDDSDEAPWAGSGPRAGGAAGPAGVGRAAVSELFPNFAAFSRAKGLEVGLAASGSRADLQENDHAQGPNILASSPQAGNLGLSEVPVAPSSLVGQSLMFKQQVSLNVPSALGVYTLRTGLLLVFYPTRLEIRNHKFQILAEKGGLEADICSLFIDPASGAIAAGLGNGAVLLLEDTSLRTTLRLSSQHALAKAANMRVMDSAVVGLSLYSTSNCLQLFAARRDGLAFYADLATGCIRSYLLAWPSGLLRALSLGHAPGRPRLVRRASSAGATLYAMRCSLILRVPSIPAQGVRDARGAPEGMTDFGIYPEALSAERSRIVLAVSDSYRAGYVLVALDSGTLLLYDTDALFARSGVPIAAARLDSVPLAADFVFNGFRGAAFCGAEGQLYLIVTMEDGRIVVLSVPGLQVLYSTVHAGAVWSEVSAVIQAPAEGGREGNRDNRSDSFTVAGAPAASPGIGDHLLLSSVGGRDVLLCRAAAVSAGSQVDGRLVSAAPSGPDQRASSLLPLLMQLRAQLPSALSGPPVVHVSGRYAVFPCAGGVYLYSLPELLPLGELRGRTGPPATLAAIDPCGLYLAVSAGGANGAVDLVEFATGDQVARFDDLPGASRLEFTSPFCLSCITAGGCCLDISLDGSAAENVRDFLRGLEEQDTTAGAVWAGCDQVSWGDGVGSWRTEANLPVVAPRPEQPAPRVSKEPEHHPDAAARPRSAGTPTDLPPAATFPEAVELDAPEVRVQGPDSAGALPEEFKPVSFG